jgi:hypothetical protein
MAPRVGLDVVTKRKILITAGNRTLVVQSFILLSYRYTYFQKKCTKTVPEIPELDFVFL